MLTTFFDDLAAWWATVSPEFAFLLGLPFVVAACGLAAECWRRHRGPHDV
jgi:hypothetical protein